MTQTQAQVTATDLSSWLRASLAARDWTHEDLAERIGRTRQTVSRWCTGDRPSYRSLVQVLQALEATDDERAAVFALLAA